MSKIERRRPENAQLREKINHIQDLSQQVFNLIDHIQAQTVVCARTGEVVDLPSASLAASLSHTFKEQRLAVSQIQHGITGSSNSVNSTLLITDAEFDALMR